MGDATTGHLRPGDWIAGKYQVEHMLGAGGMGVVVAARHAALRQAVAVKLLLPSAMRFPDAAARFLREAQAAVAIRSEHVARVLDVGTLDSGAPFMVMEYLAGKDLRALARERGPLPVTEVVDFVLQAGEAIAEAHSLGIVHRDLKPANIFLTTRADGSPLVKVLDFGLSKVTGSGPEHERGLTATDVVAGSPEYMSPEQVRSLKDVDCRTDIWALGVVLYELLTGHRPFQGPTAAAVCASVAADTAASVRDFRPELPEEIAKVIEGCLVKDRHRRTSAMGELAAALAPFAPARSGPSIERIARISAGNRGSIADAGAARDPGPVVVHVAIPSRGATPSQAAATAPHGIAGGDAMNGGSAPGAPGPVAHDGARSSAVRQDGTVTLPRASHASIGVPSAAPQTQATSAALPGGGPMAGVSATQARERSDRLSTTITTGPSGHTDGWGQTRRSHPPSRRGPVVAVIGATGAAVVAVGVILWQVVGASGGAAAGAEDEAPAVTPATNEAALAPPGPNGTIAILPVNPVPPAAPDASAGATPAPSASAAAPPTAAPVKGTRTTAKPGPTRPATPPPAPVKSAGSVLDTPL